jgi:ubiquinone/menaquinone biosynthesis C-methylase UbiE
MEEIRPKRAIDAQYDKGITAEKYAAASIENAEKDIGRKFLQENIADLSRDSVIADIGCGNGVDLQSYKLMGFSKLIGIDPSRKFLEEIKQKQGDAVQLREGTFESIPLADAEVDAVVSRFAMHYAKSIEKSLREVERILKRGGHLVAIVSHPDADARETPDKSGNITITLFKGAVSITFPQHRIDEYFSEDFLSKFTIQKKFEYCGTEQDRGLNGAPNALGFVAVKN